MCIDLGSMENGTGTETVVAAFYITLWSTQYVSGNATGPTTIDKHDLCSALLLTAEVSTTSHAAGMECQSMETY